MERSVCNKEKMPKIQVSLWSGTEISGWTCFLVLKAVFDITTLPITSASGAISCPRNQTVKLGEIGVVYCNFPEDFNYVYWFDNVTDGSSPVIRFQPNERVKHGPGFDSGEYGVREDGSLVILNVSSWHERSYKVIVSRQSFLTPENHIVSLSVSASPIDRMPTIQCHSCHQEYYHSVTEGDILNCYFSATRPPVQLEWFEQFSDGYHHVEHQQFSITENRNGTYNNVASLFLLKNSPFFIYSFVCRGTWPLSDWRREREVLLDFSSNVSFSDVSPNLRYMEIGKHSKLRCGDSASTYVVWKRILSDSELEVIGFHSHQKTETVIGIDNVEVSTEGSLIFSPPQVHHERIYACIYGDGEKEEIEMTSVKLLIPPSPPYIQITGCNDASTHCVFREENTKEEVTCAVYGARPNVTLKWVAEDEHKISFFNHKEVHKERGTTSDTVLTVQYSVSQDILCGEEIVIKCHLYGPLTNIMKAESTAVAIIPATCMEHRGNSEQIFLILTSVLVFVILGVSVVFVRISCFKRLGHHGWMERASLRKDSVVSAGYSEGHHDCSKQRLSPEHRDVNGGNDEGHQDSIKWTSLSEDPVVSAGYSVDPQDSTERTSLREDPVVSAQNNEETVI